jgi:hypothetical protein
MSPPTLRVPVFDGDVLSFDVATVAQSQPNFLSTGGLTSSVERDSLYEGLSLAAAPRQNGYRLRQVDQQKNILHAPILPLFRYCLSRKVFAQNTASLRIVTINPSHRIENSFPFRLGCCQKKQADWMAKGQFSPVRRRDYD